jgi:hypothetical protein
MMLHIQDRKGGQKDTNEEDSRDDGYIPGHCESFGPALAAYGNRLVYGLR